MCLPALLLASMTGAVSTVPTKGENGESFVSSRGTPSVRSRELDQVRSTRASVSPARDLINLKEDIHDAGDPGSHQHLSGRRLKRYHPLP